MENGTPQGTTIGQSAEQKEMTRQAYELDSVAAMLWEREGGHSPSDEMLFDWLRGAWNKLRRIEAVFPWLSQLNLPINRDAQTNLPWPERVRLLESERTALAEQIRMLNTPVRCGECSEEFNVLHVPSCDCRLATDHIFREVVASVTNAVVAMRAHDSHFSYDKALSEINAALKFALKTHNPSFSGDDGRGR